MPEPEPEDPEVKKCLEQHLSNKLYISFLLSILALVLLYDFLTKRSLEAKEVAASRYRTGGKPLLSFQPLARGCARIFCKFWQHQVSGRLRYIGQWPLSRKWRPTQKLRTVNVIPTLGRQGGEEEKETIGRRTRSTELKHRQRMSLTPPGTTLVMLSHSTITTCLFQLPPLLPAFGLWSHSPSNATTPSAIP